MKNITVAIDETTYRMARIRAAELNTSVSALVREYLRILVQGRLVPVRVEGRPATGESARHRRTVNEVVEEIRARNSGFSAADNLPREELYDRNRARQGWFSEDAQSEAGSQPT